MMYIVITSYNEPKSTERAVKAFLEQNIQERYKLLVIDPFPEVGEYIKKAFKGNKNIEFILDEGEGKSYALNLLLSRYFSENKDDIFIFTDGDVYVSNNSIQEIKEQFKDPSIGCVTGRPISINPRNDKYGYFSHVAFEGIHKVRKRLAEKKAYFECSGYLFAIRNGVITEFPMDTSEDSIIPFLFWQKGYKIGYAQKAEVYVLNPKNKKDYFAQKVRNIKAHENLNKYFNLPNAPQRTKSFWNEVREGLVFTILYPRNIKEMWWTPQLFIIRLQIYLKAFKELKKKKEYSDGWRETEIESTKPMD